MKYVELIYPMESLLPECVKDSGFKSGIDDHWVKGHIYIVPDKFYLNPNYFRVLKEDEIKKWEKIHADIRKEKKNEVK